MFPGVYRNHPIHLSKLLCNGNSSLADGPILMKLCTVAVYNLRMCIKKDNYINAGPKYFKGDNL